MRVQVKLAALIVVLAAGVLTFAAAAQRDTGSIQPIDAQKSSITIRVYKTGMFSAFAHNHEIHAPIQEGSLDEAKRAVEFTVDAKQLRVLDPDASASDRIQVQANMQGPQVLGVAKFPEIKFTSASIEPNGAGKWKVLGNLTLHGQTHPVTVDVQGGSGHYTGSATLKQTDFGITPISIAGGSVKVKDEVRVEFEIFGK